MNWILVHKEKINYNKITTKIMKIVFYKEENVQNRY